MLCYEYYEGSKHSIVLRKILTQLENKGLGNEHQYQKVTFKI